VPQPRPCDSSALEMLRVHFHLMNPGFRATPLRLGRFARDQRRTITDFGAHSERWIRTFKEGETSEFCWPESLGV
jgi:hypothetical protein